MSEDTVSKKTYLKVLAERDALIQAGLRCNDSGVPGVPNPDLPQVELAISFINSLIDSWKAYEKLYEISKAKNDRLEQLVHYIDDVANDRSEKARYRIDWIRDELFHAIKEINGEK